MKTILKIAGTTLVLLLMLITDISFLSVELVPEVQALFGVRRRTAVIAYSAGKSSANASAAAASQQQQAATAQQQSATAQQQATTSKAASGVPIGTVVDTLPGGCQAVTVGNNQYQDCGGSFYKAAFQGNKLIYVVVGSPL